jgi:hypothetical protein
MIEVRTAKTTEIDEIDDAVAEIIREIDPDSLSANSAGILFCHYDYVQSGVIQALYEALGFDIIGMTSTTNGTQSGYDMYGLSLAVLTSDDVRFAATMTAALTRDNFAQEINNTYARVRTEISRDPALSITFVPFMEAVSAAEMAQVYDQASNGSPCWGSVTTSVELFFDQCFTVYNDQVIEDGFAMLLLDGDVQLRFLLNSIPDQLISDRRAVVTKSQGYRIYEIDDKPALDFINSFGLKVDKDNLPLTNPMLVYYGKSTVPVTLGIYAIFDDGSLLLGGAIAAGDIVTVGSTTSEGIIQTAEQLIEQIKTLDNPAGVLILPCVTRFYSLSPDRDAELELVQRQLGLDQLPYLMGYSGGEICPVKNERGELVNRFHNYTITACAL